jgi:hypothetical protein
LIGRPENGLRLVSDRSIGRLIRDYLTQPREVDMRKIWRFVREIPDMVGDLLTGASLRDAFKTTRKG